MGGKQTREELVIKCWKSTKKGSKAKPVRTWLAELDDQSFRQMDKLLEMLRQERKDLSMPYSRHLGEGLHELRDSRQSGAGYRLYYCWEGDTIVILLVGGDKSTQDKDIEVARKRMNDEE